MSKLVNMPMSKIMHMPTKVGVHTQHMHIVKPGQDQINNKMYSVVGRQGLPDYHKLKGCP